MLRGEVFWADLEPTVDREANKVRPVVIVSNNGANAAAIRSRGVVTVVPLTSRVDRVHPFQALVAIQRDDSSMESKAQAEQVRTISITRLRQSLGFINGADMSRVDAALRLHLNLH